MNTSDIFRNRFWLWSVFGIAALGIAFLPFPTSASPPVERSFKVAAKSFEFSPPILNVNPGDVVTIEMISTDVVHGLFLDGYDLQMTAEPGRSSKLVFVADQSGSFRFRCSVSCGALHPFMIGKLKVGSNLLMWRGIGLAFLAAIVSIWSFLR